MFGVQFYPTPRPVAYRMIEPYIKEHRDPRWGETIYSAPTAKRILEPSAGNGAIVDFLTTPLEWRQKDDDPEYPKWRYGGQWSKDKVFCIELDPELRLILQGKGYNVIDSDFLTYDGKDVPVDMIIMNPPFENGVDHLLHAWEILEKGDIVCLLNSETLKNPYTQKRKVLAELIRRHGRFEHIGQAFADADVPTDVEVAIVWLEKKEKKSAVNLDDQRFEWDAEAKDEPFTANTLTRPDTIQSLVDQYNAARRVLEEMADKRSQFKFYVDVFKRAYNNTYDMDKAMGESLEDQIKRLKEAAWRYVFERTRLGELTTSKYQKKFFELRDQQERMAFSVRNIHDLLTHFFVNQKSILYECIVDVFDDATSHHRDNRVGEGWKTNLSYKLNYKIIYPNSVYSRSSLYDKYFFDDLDKVCCYLTGRNFSNLRTIKGAIENHFAALDNTRVGKGDPVGYSDAFFSDFFRIRIYKKGTTHLVFRDESICDTLNIEAAKGKGWMIGGGY